ncbi:MAG TPA: MBG domain-containing protein [Pyrinomonadaceae bacterium]
MKAPPKRRFKTWQFAVVCVLAAATLGMLSTRRSHAQSGTTYMITDLGPVGATQSRAYSINNSGDVVGDFATSGVNHPFYRKGATTTDITPGSGFNGTAFGVNSSGSTAGFSEAMAGQRAFFWRDINGNGISDAGELTDFFPPNATGIAHDVNDNNRVVGLLSNDSPEGVGAGIAFVWDAGAGLQTLSGSRAVSINNTGNIALWASAPTHAFMLRNSTYIDLGTLDNTAPQLNSFAWRISEDNHIVGYSQTTSMNVPIPYHAFVWFDANGNNFSDPGDMKDLGVLTGYTQSHAYDINASGLIVGTSELSSGARHAVLWQDDNCDGQFSQTEVRDLNALISDASWTLQEAQSINDGGQIVGFGMHSGQLHAFLLTPPSKTPTSISNVSGSGVYGGPATLTAKLTAGCAAALIGKPIIFSVDGNAVCGGTGQSTCPITNEAGIATLNVSGFNTGPHSLGASFASDVSFLGSGGTGPLTVNKANQSITVNTHAPATATYNTNFTVAATSSSGFAVSYSSSGACTNTGAMFMMTSGTGTCTVKYDQVGDGNFNAASQVTENVTAQKATATITLSNLTQTYDGNPKFVTTSTTPPGLTVNVTYSQNSVPVASPTNIGIYDVSAMINDANYQGTANGTLTITESAPMLLLETGTNNAAAVDSVTFVRGPFRVVDNFNFSSDHLTRIIIFTSLLNQPDSTLMVRAAGIDLPVENVGTVSGVTGLSASYIVVKLPQGLTTGDLQLTVTLRGVTSNSATLTIIP